MMRLLYLVCVRILITLGFPFLLVAMPAVRAGNTACASSQLDWYTSIVGETPCATYERLRQICNSYYQLGTFVPSPPGDHCDDQFSTCCCNTVAFQLSMLCLNCQHDTVSGQQTGVDAPPGTYTQYRGACGEGVDNLLPEGVQKAVCNLNIRMEDFLYGGLNGGAWSYANTSALAEGQRVKDDNQTFTHCPGQVPELQTASTMQTTPTSVSKTPRATSTGRPSSGSGPGSSFSMNAIVGGIVGACCAAAGAAGFLLWRRRRSRQHLRVSTATDTARTAGHVQNETSAIEPYAFTKDRRAQPDGKRSRR